MNNPYQQQQPYRQQLPYQQHPYQQQPYQQQPYQHQQPQQQLYSADGRPLPPNDDMITPEVKALTILFGLLDIGLAIFQIMYLVRIMNFNISHDFYYNDDIGFYFIISLALSLGTYLVRVSCCLIYLCRQGVTNKQKLVISTTLLSPPLKYQLLRKNPNEQVRIITAFRSDTAGILYFIVAGICSILTYQVAFIDPDLTAHDDAFIIFGGALLSSALIQGLTLIMHSKWIKKQIHIEKARRIRLVVGEPLMNHEYNSFNSVSTGNSIYMGEPVVQNASQNQYNPLSAYGQPMTH